MNLDEERINYLELIISDRTPNNYSKELFGQISKFVLTERKSCRMVAMREQGTKESKWHCHVFIHWPMVQRIKTTTFRSQIKKEFGQSNTKYDWKLRNIKHTVIQAFKYITKGGDLLAHIGENAFYLFERYKGTYVPTPIKDGNKKILQEVREAIKRCDNCKEWNEPFCKEDAVRAVIEIYDNSDKVYDIYRMKNIARTVYFKLENNREELQNIIMDF